VELSEYAKMVVTTTDLEQKLRPSSGPISDDSPGCALRLDAPGRPDALSIQHHRRVKVPNKRGIHDPPQRARILHALANHELQAAELFAWAILAFPEAPTTFRRGLLGILEDEQRHCRMYIDRLETLGGGFGYHRVTGHFCKKVDGITTPLEFVCAMGLTFENANLDHANELAEAATDAGDLETADVLGRVHRDEIRHVRFAWRWLLELKPEAQDPWDAYCANVEFPLGPSRARGATFDPDARREAGIDEAFIARLADTGPERPGGVPRS